MTRRFRSIHDTRRTIVRISVIVVCCGVVLLSPLMSVLVGPSHALARPFWFLSERVQTSTEKTLQSTQSKKTLLEDVNRLLEENARLQSLVAENRFLQFENEELKTLVGLRQGTKKTITARILARPPKTWYDALVLAVGSDDGVAVGNRVYAQGTIPLGEVIEVTGTTSIVELYSASNRKTDAIVVPGNTPVVVSGAGNGSYHFSIHRDIPLDESAVIVLPEGDFLAEIVSIDFDTRDPFRSVRAVASFNLQSLRFVTLALD